MLFTSTLWLWVQKAVFFPCSSRDGRSFCYKQPLKKLSYEINHAASYVLHRDDNYPQIGSLAALQDFQSCSLPLNYALGDTVFSSPVLIKPKIFPWCVTPMPSNADFYDLEFFPISSSDVFVYSCCENHAFL